MNTASDASTRRRTPKMPGSQVRARSGAAASEGNEPADASMPSGFRPPELRQSVLLFKPLSLWHFAPASGANHCSAPPYLSPRGPRGLGTVMWPEPGLKAQTEDSRWRRRGVGAALGRGKKTSSSVKTSLVNYRRLPEVSNNQRGPASPQVRGRPRVGKGPGDTVQMSYK